jgi:chromosome segregation ATPase
MFYNYDFKNQVAPLRRLISKGKNQETGKSNSLNQNFQKMQDLVAGSFANLGFERGISRGIDNTKHVKKADWVIKQREEAERQLKQIIDQINTSVSNLKELQIQVELGNGDLNKLQNTIEEKRSALMNITKKIHGAESNLSKQQIRLLEPITAAINSLTACVDLDAVHSINKLINEYDNAKNELDLEPESLKELDDVLSHYRPRF